MIYDGALKIENDVLMINISAGMSLRTCAEKGTIIEIGGRKRAVEQLSLLWQRRCVTFLVRKIKRCTRERTLYGY